MSKFFFKGRIDKREDYGSAGFKPKQEKKLGSPKHPLTLSVKTVEREKEVLALVEEHQLIANITIDANADENILELTGVLNKPKTTTFDKVPARNEPCSCGSGKKYKKCCA